MIKTSVTGHLTLKQQISLLQLTPARRKRLLKLTVRGVQKFSRARLRQGLDLDGKPWAPRKGKTRRKMLRGLSKPMRHWATADKGVVDFTGGGLTGQIARAHQEGVDELMTAQRMAAIHGKPDYNAPATRAQARALKQEGFKRRRKSGKGYAQATMKWIRGNMTVGQAGVILKEMRNSAGKQSWVIPLPQRSFLGATAQEVDQLVQDIFNDTREQMKLAG